MDFEFIDKMNAEELNNYYRESLIDNSNYLEIISACWCYAGNLGPNSGCGYVAIWCAGDGYNTSNSTACTNECNRYGLGGGWINSYVQSSGDRNGGGHGYCINKQSNFCGRYQTYCSTDGSYCRH